MAAQNATQVPSEPKTVNLDALKEEVRKLNALLDDRQPGLMSWNMLLHDQLKTIHDMLCGVVP